MSHSGNSEDVEELEKLIEDKEMAMNLFGGIEEGGGPLGEHFFTYFFFRSEPG